MQVRFEEDSRISTDNPEVIIRAEELRGQAKEVLAYVERFQSVSVLPIKSDGELIMVPLEDVILADIQKTTLLIYTVAGVYQTTETLTHFYQRVGRDFLQISKHAIINIHHLNSLSDSFSGNLTAKLTNDLKTEVSRRYVKSLMNYLGI